VEVKAAIRRTRLPFVASLLLAVLLGAPAAVPAPAVQPAPVSVAAAQSSISQVEAEPAGAVEVPPVLLEDPVVVRPVLPALRDQAARAATTPRAPPR
jgi:hypothetical protein